MKPASSIMAIVWMLVPILGFGQKIHFKGVVLDSLTRAPVPYATVEFLGQGGAVCDSSGRFAYIGEEADLKGSVVIRNLGYFVQSMGGEELLKMDTILLRNQPVILPEVQVITALTRRSTELGTKGNRNDASYGMNAWMQVGLAMDNPGHEIGFIRSVWFFIPKSGKYRAPFRVRLYERDADGKPGRDLLRADLILRAEREGWVKADLEGQHILVPGHGFVAAMEWINSGDRYRYEVEIRGEKKSFYGQELGSVLQQDTPNTWIRLIGKDWILDDRSPGNGTFGFRNALIKAEIWRE